MKTGAVAILDFLGFKGIWRRFTAEQAIQDLKSLRDAATSLRELERKLIPLPSELESASAAINVEYKFLSDTVVICAWYDDEEAFEKSLGAPKGSARLQAINSIAIEILGVFHQTFRIESGLNFRGLYFSWRIYN